MSQDESAETLGGGAMSRWLGLRKPARAAEPTGEPETAEPPARVPMDEAALRERGVLLGSTQQFAGLAGLRLEPPVQLSSTALFHSAEVGAFTYLNGGSMYDAVIGRYCSIGQSVRLLPRNHPVDGLSTHPFGYGGLHFLPVGDGFEQAEAMRAHKGMLTHAVADKKTTLGDDVWLGDAVTVVNGVTIGTGAVVGACSVVTKDVPPYAIVAGNPARVIRMRFPEPIVEVLLASRWWRLAPWDLVKFDLSAPRRAAIAARQAIRKGEAQPYAPAWLTIADVRAL